MPKSWNAHARIQAFQNKKKVVFLKQTALLTCNSQALL